MRSQYMRLTAVLLGTVAVCLAGLLFAVHDYTRQGASSPASRVAPAVAPAPPAAEPALAPSPYPSAPAIMPPPEIVSQPAPAVVGGTGPLALAPAALPAAQAQPEATPPPRGHGPRHDH